MSEQAIAIFPVVYAENDLITIENTETTSERITYTLNISDGNSGILIAALYNKLDQIIKLSADESQQTQIITFDLENGLKECTVKFFLWDSLLGITPIARSVKNDFDINQIKPTPTPLPTFNIFYMFNSISYVLIFS